MKEDDEPCIVNCIGQYLDKKETDGVLVWPKLFFTSDVHIVGLGLDYQEADLWWLLSLRAAFFSSEFAKGREENRIFLYTVKIKERERGKTEKREDGCEDDCIAKEQVLQTLGVDVCPVEASDYPEGYQKIYRMIRGKLSKDK